MVFKHLLVRIVASLTKLQGMSPLEELLHIVAAMRYFVLFSVQSSLTQLFIYLQIFEKCRVILEQGSQIIKADVLGDINCRVLDI